MQQPTDHRPHLPVPLRRIEQAILQVRGHRVMLDADLAALYGVETKALVRAVKRNADRFPEDFMFQLNQQEFDNLRCQIGTSSSWGGRRQPTGRGNAIERPAEQPRLDSAHLVAILGS
jgi:hypothetical protein